MTKIKFNPYQAPSDEVFNDIKKNAIKIWQTYDNTYGYVDEKVNRIKDLKNIKDNYWTMVGMFDTFNQRKLIDAVKPESKALILKALYL